MSASSKTSSRLPPGTDVDVVDGVDVDVAWPRTPLRLARTTFEVAGGDVVELDVEAVEAVVAGGGVGRRGVGRTGVVGRGWVGGGPRPGGVGRGGVGRGGGCGG